MSMPALGRAARETASKSSKNVMLSAVPLTVTVNDIKALSHKAVRPGGSTDTSYITVPRDSSTTSLAAGISSIEFVRTSMLNMSGKAVVRFQNEDLAREFAETANGKMVGGNRITAQIGARVRDYPSPSIQLLAEFQKRSTGRIVILKGVPSYINAGDLMRILRSNYKLAEDTVTIDGIEQHWAIRRVPDMHGRSSVSSYLIRLQTVADAMMLVNRWHRTIWTPRNVARSAAWVERKRPDGHENDEDDDDLQTVPMQSSTADHWQGKLRSDDRIQERDRDESITPIRSIIDAYIMPETTVYMNT